jgi:hypothetical protein
MTFKYQFPPKLTSAPDGPRFMGPAEAVGMEWLCYSQRAEHYGELYTLIEQLSVRDREGLIAERDRLLAAIRDRFELSRRYGLDRQNRRPSGSADVPHPVRRAVERRSGRRRDPGHGRAGRVARYSRSCSGRFTL